jgi:hypothetical protein
MASVLSVNYGAKNVRIQEIDLSMDALDKFVGEMKRTVKV